MKKTSVKLKRFLEKKAPFLEICCQILRIVFSIGEGKWKKSQKIKQEEANKAFEYYKTVKEIYLRHFDQQERRVVDTDFKINFIEKVYNLNPFDG